MATGLPPFAPFPSTPWRASIVPSEWEACLDAWISLVEAHLALTEAQSSSISSKDGSVVGFLESFTKEIAAGGPAILGGGPSAKSLIKGSFLLTSKLLRSPSPPSGLAQWGFLADLSRAYRRERAGDLLSQLSGPAQGFLDASLSGLKKFLIGNLDDGINGDLKAVEERLGRVNPLIHASPSVASFFLAGSDFLDGLIGCYKLMNPPLRKVIITTTYLCLIGLVEAEPPKTSMLIDQLYALKVAAGAHKAGPVNANDSLVPELVTVTPLLQQVQHKLDASGSATNRPKSVLAELAAFRKAGGLVRPKRLIRRKIDKGKGRAPSDQAMDQQEIHIHRMSQISQVQDLFSDLGSGFVSKLLDEYGDDPEQVIAHMLDGSLPMHLQDADRSEELYVQIPSYGNRSTANLSDHPTARLSTATSPHMRRRPSFPHGTTSLTRTSLIFYKSTPLSSISASATPARQRTTSSGTAPPRPARPPSSPPSQPSTRTTTSATTPTTPPTWEAPSTPPAAPPLPGRTIPARSTRRPSTARTGWTGRCSAATPRPDGAPRGLRCGWRRT